jgi:hypothetical protein
LYGDETAPSREEPFQETKLHFEAGIATKPKYRQQLKSGVATRSQLKKPLNGSGPLSWRKEQPHSIRRTAPTKARQKIVEFDLAQSPQAEIWRERPGLASHIISKHAARVDGRA